MRIGKQSQRISLPRRARDLIGHLRHLFGALQERLAIACTNVPGIQRHQPPGRVEHISGAHVIGLEIPDRVGEHRGHLVFASPPEHGCGSAGGVRIARRLSMRGDADSKSTTQDHAPWPHDALGAVHSTARDHATDFGVGPEQGDNAVVVLAQRRPREPRGAAFGV